MFKSPLLSPALKRARTASRLLFLVVIPLGLLLHFGTREMISSSAGPTLAAQRPTGWHYLTATSVEPRGDRILYDGAALDAALAAGHAAPLFALTKYPHPHAGLNPLIGINVGFEDDAELPSATQLLERSVADVQQRSGNALALLEPITPTTVAGRPAARVVLHTPTPPPGSVPDKMVVVALLEGRLSFMVAASGATAGADEISAEVADFLGSLQLSTP